jgi:hypothetical protein
MIGDGLSRGVINSRIGKIKRIFRWAYPRNWRRQAYVTRWRL